MYSVELGFNSKSSSPCVKKAIKIANEIGFKVDEKEKNKIIITSNELNKKIIELLTLIGHLNKTCFKIDGEEIEEPHELIGIINCKRRNDCKGKCFIQEDVWNNVFKAIGVIKAGKYDNYGKSTFYFLKDPNLIIEESDEEIIIDNVVLFNRYNDSRKLLRKYCSKFNDEEIIKKFKALPDRILIKKVKFKDEYSDNDLSDNEDEEEDKNMDIMIKKFGDDIEERLRKALNEFKKTNN